MYSRTFKNRYYTRMLQYEEKIPRKAKKFIIGKKISKKELKRKLANYKNGDNGFCIKCGCNITISTGQMAEYPETYVKYFCARCGELVAYEDNSPIISVLDEYYLE